MIPILFAITSQYVFGILLAVTGIFLILLVLVQRGRGGGLAGAFGGMGGQSAFGTKAGDLFTRLTIAVASIWILLGVASVYFLGGGQTNKFDASDRERSTFDTLPLDEDAAGGGVGLDDATGGLGAALPDSGGDDASGDPSDAE